MLNVFLVCVFFLFLCLLFIPTGTTDDVGRESDLLTPGGLSPCALDEGVAGLIERPAPCERKNLFFPRSIRHGYSFIIHI